MMYKNDPVAERRFQELLAEDPEDIIYKADRRIVHRTSRDSTFTCGLLDCNGLVVLNCASGSMSHIPPGLTQATYEGHFGQLEHELETDAQDLTGIAICGNQKLMDILEAIAKKRGVNLRTHRSIAGSYGPKALIASPSTREVILYNRAIPITLVDSVPDDKRYEWDQHEYAFNYERFLLE